MRWLLAGNSRGLALALLLSVIAYLFAGALMFTSGYMISLAATIPLTVLALHLPSIFVRIFGIGKPPIQYAYRLTSHDWVLRMTSRLRLCLYEALRRRTTVTQSREKTSRVLSMLTDDIGHAQDLVLRGALPIAAAWAVAIVIVILAGALSPVIGVALLGLLLLSCVVAPLATASLNLGDLKALKAENDMLYEALSDNASGIVDWMLSGRRGDFVNLQMGLFEEKAITEKRIRRRRRICTLAAQAIFCACVLAIIVWAAMTFAPAMQGSGLSEAFAQPSGFADWIASATAINASPYPANWIAAFALCFFPLIEAFLQVEQSAETFMQQRKSVDQLIGYMGESSKIGEDDLEAIGKPSANLGSAFKAPSLNIRSLDFAYGDDAIFNDFNLDIPYGEKIAITGRSGIGKTTLVSLLHGDLTPGAGSVSIGGVEAGTLSSNMHELICVIGQFPYLFDMSLRDNLLIAKPDASDAELENVLELVGLKGTYEALPGGLDAKVSESGSRFSGGERHRIALARSFLADQPIVILDEPFANLDSRTEEEIMDVLFDLFAEKTLIVITHHTNGLERFDQILEL